MSGKRAEEDKEVITVQFMDRTMQIKAAVDKADALQKAAVLLNDKMREARESKQTLDNERIALIAGLNLAYEVITAKKQKDSYLESISSRIKDLQDRLDDVLA
jgi:cell division protein ZapA